MRELNSWGKKKEKWQVNKKNKVVIMKMVVMMMIRIMRGKMNKMEIKKTLENKGNYNKIKKKMLMMMMI